MFPVVALPHKNHRGDEFLNVNDKRKKKTRVCISLDQAGESHQIFVQQL
jgi:hypothetical protein